MALTRKLLKSFQLEDSVIDSIIEAHAETVEGLKNQITEATKTAEDMQAITKERDDLKKQIETLTKANGDAAKIQQEFDDYKAGIEAEKTAAQHRSVMDVFLRDRVGIQRDSARKLILDALDLNKYPQENGQLKNAENVAGELKTQYADFVSTTDEKGVPPVNPPGGKNPPEDAFEKGFDM